MSNADPKRVFPRSTFEIGLGDPALRTKTTVTRPSAGRLPYGPSGRLREPGPLPADAYSAPDLKGLPWAREPWDAWSTPTLRVEVLEWLSRYVRMRPAVVGWRVREIAGRDRSMLRLPPDEQALLVVLTCQRGDRRSRERFAVEVAVPFPVPDRASAERIAARLALAQQALDAQLGITP